MFQKENKLPTIDDMLKDIEGLNGNPDVKAVLQRFIKDNLLGATGVIIIYTHGKSVNIDGSKFSDPEAVWALEKAKNQILNKGLSFND